MKKQAFKKGEIIIYKTSQNEVELKVHFENENIWLTQNQIALLFGTQRPAITKHLKNIFESGELEEKVVSSILEHTTEHGAIKGKTQTQRVKFYNLDAIISVGYRVNSQRATQFRIWATKVLKQYLVRGYAINEKRLSEAKNRFHELQDAYLAFSLLTSAKSYNALSAMMDKLKILLEDNQTEDNQKKRSDFEEAQKKFINGLRNEFFIDKEINFKTYDFKLSQEKKES